ncbi:Hsp20/alpha crystallin family protein [Gulosibacter chungangensis]|uniref:Hsp20/alpha crystallin family protein n=1 Tax=Gulosibacter chungangensis TaxID=979746 RepID=A0A7J5BBI7_9MICO|nr:Hsp20/alpha crystallin family protein [Gulosibacter chungangensis]KAB1643502.1 Hsp20/alpha crystallin family protein [Gulosibacter chungangensis]
MALPVLRTSDAVDRWNPFREFENLYSQMGQLMNSTFGQLDETAAGWSPLADLSETEDAYLVEVDLPGVKQKDIDIELHGNLLSVSGELKEKEREGLMRHRTRRVGQFRYRVQLPDAVDADKVEAALSDGVLTVTVPKIETAKPKRIAIKGS